MPTLFTGHMSGVNWIPSWALGEDAGDERFRVVSGGRVAASRIANWYSDASIVRAQAHSHVRLPVRSQGIRLCGHGTSATKTRTAQSPRTRTAPATGSCE